MERGTGSQFRFLPRETAEMEALYNSSSNGQLGRSDVEALAAKFSAAPERAGQKPITGKQVLNWFQYKRHNMRIRGALKNDGDLQQQKQHPPSKQASSDGLGRVLNKEETSSGRTGGRSNAQTSGGGGTPEKSAGAGAGAGGGGPGGGGALMGRQGQGGGGMENEFGGRGVVAAAGDGESMRVAGGGGFPAGGTGSGATGLPQYMDYEAKSARDGAWYDVEKFVSWRENEGGEREVKVRFTGFGQEEDEWVHAEVGLRQRSLPCEGSECIGVLPNDLVLCFQEGNDQALYYDADVLDVERRQHDVRGCRCRFCVRYRHDLQEEIVPLRKICRRPETEYRLHMARMGGVPLQPSLASAAARLAMAPLGQQQVQQQLQQQKRQQLQQQQRQQQLLMQQRKNQSLVAAAVPAAPQILSQATVATGGASDGASSLAMTPTHLQAALASMPSVPTLVTSPTPSPLPSLSLPSLAPVVGGGAPQLASAASPPPPGATAPAFLSTSINGGGNGTTALAGVTGDTPPSSMSFASVVSTVPLTPVTASSLASLPAGTPPASTGGASLSLGAGTLSLGQTLLTAGKSQPTATPSANGPAGATTSTPAPTLPSASGSLQQQAAVSLSDASVSNGQDTGAGLKRARPDMVGVSGTGSSSTGGRGRGFLAAASTAVSNLTGALQQTVACSGVSGNNAVVGMKELKRVKLEHGGVIATPVGLGAAHGAGSAAPSGMMQSMSPSLTQLSMSGTSTVGRGLISTGSGVGATGSQLVGAQSASHQSNRTCPVGSVMPSVVAAPGRVVLPQTVGSSESLASRASDNNSKRLRIDNTGLTSMGSGAVATHGFSWAPAGMQSVVGGALMKGLNKGAPLTGGQTGVAGSMSGSGSLSSSQTARIGHSFGGSLPARNPALPQQAIPSSADMLRTRVQELRTGVKKSRSGPDSVGTAPLPSAVLSSPGPHGNGIHNTPVVGLKRPKLEMVDSESMPAGMTAQGERTLGMLSVAMTGSSSAAGEAVGVTANGFPISSTRLGSGEGIAIRGVSGEGAGAQGGRSGGVGDGVGSGASLSHHSSVAGCSPCTTPASCTAMDVSMAASAAFPVPSSLHMHMPSPVTSSLHMPMPSGDTSSGKAKNPTWTESPRDSCPADSPSRSITTSPMVQSSAAMDSHVRTLAVGSSASDDPLLAKGNLVQDVAQLGLTQRMETSGSAASCEMQVSGNADRSTSSITAVPSSSSSSLPPARLSVNGGNVMEFVVESPD